MPKGRKRKPYPPPSGPSRQSTHQERRRHEPYQHPHHYSGWQAAPPPPPLPQHFHGFDAPYQQPGMAAFPPGYGFGYGYDHGPYGYAPDQYHDDHPYGQARYRIPPQVASFPHPPPMFHEPAYNQQDHEPDPYHLERDWYRGEDGGGPYHPERNWYAGKREREPHHEQGDMYAPPHMQARGYHSSATRDSSRILAPAIRSKARPSYMSQANRKLQPPYKGETPPKKLLVLDLNGTLVYRKKNAANMSISSAAPTPRPYLDCFLQYCLGISVNTQPDQVPASPGQAEPSQRPHGSHFWKSSKAPESKGCYEIIVWSSARPANVNSMVLAGFSEQQRSTLLRVWARDTLVPARLFNHKAESIKDLEIIWTELNAWANRLPSPGRLMAEERDEADRARPDTIESAKSKSSSSRESVSAALEAALVAAELGPWGQHNTVLLDDSADKARLQPFNQILIPEFGREAAHVMDQWIAQQSPGQGQGQGQGHPCADEAEGDEDDGYGTDLSVSDTGKRAREVEEEKEQEQAGDEQPKRGGRVPERALDDVLLQTIGVLEELRWQKDVSSYIQSKGLGQYGQAKAKKLKMIAKRQKNRGSPEYWAEQGRAACESLGILVTPWVARNRPASPSPSPCPCPPPGVQ